MSVRFPNNKQRLTIVGRTGSGKTVAANWHLSTRDFDVRPWVIYDFKGDQLINSIDRAEYVDTDFVPGKKHKGLFIVQPLPHELEQVDAQLWKIWERENVGVYVDEGYMFNEGNRPIKSYETLLVQGRSKRIPMISLSQRPSWVSRFCFSEADFFQLFFLTDKRDRKTVEAFIPYGLDYDLPEYHSYYYDVAKKQLNIFKPVPSEDVILETIDAKLKKHRTFI